MNSRPHFFFHTVPFWLLISLLQFPPIYLPGINIFKRDTRASVIGYHIIETMEPKTLDLTQEWPTRKDKFETLESGPVRDLTSRK